MTLGQKVNTPNGAGLYQGRMYSDGGVYLMVSHSPSAEIDKEKCMAYWYAGGIWKLAGYDAAQVTPG